MKKIDSKKIAKVTSLLRSTVGLEKLPTLAQFLSDVTFDDGDVSVDREPPSIFIVPRDGVLQVTLKEPSQRLRLRVEVATPSALWATLEAALSDPGSMWEVDPYAAPKRFKKK